MGPGYWGQGPRRGFWVGPSHARGSIPLFFTPGAWVHLGRYTCYSQNYKMSSPTISSHISFEVGSLVNIARNIHQSRTLCPDNSNLPNFHKKYLIMGHLTYCASHVSSCACLYLLGGGNGLKSNCHCMSRCTQSHPASKNQVLVCYTGH